MPSALPKTSAILSEGIERGQHLGAQLFVSVRGAAVADIALGQSRPGVAMTPDTLMLWMSMGKPVTAVLIARLVDAGKLDVAQPVAEFIPEFGSEGKHQVTVAHLLTHSGGFRHVGSNWSSEPWEAILRRISGSTLEEEWVVGETAGYHTSSSWFVLAEVARRGFGYDEPAEMYRRELFEPLEMPDCWIGMPRHKWIDYGTRVAYMYDSTRSASHSATARNSATGRREAETRAQTAESTEDPGRAQPATTHDAGTGLPLADPWHGSNPWRGWHGKPLGFANSEPGSVLSRPGGNARGPMSQLARLYEQLLSDRGDLAGTPRKRFLSAETARLFTSCRRCDVYDKTFGTRLDWGYGFIINAPGRRFPYNYGPHASPAAFGHSGNQSTCAFADPAHALAVCWSTNGMPGELPHQRRQTAVNKALYEDLELA